MCSILTPSFMVTNEESQTRLVMHMTSLIGEGFFSNFWERGVDQLRMLGESGEGSYKLLNVRIKLILNSEKTKFALTYIGKMMDTYLLTYIFYAKTF